MNFPQNKCKKCEKVHIFHTGWAITNILDTLVMVKPYHVRAGTGKSHEFGVKLQTGDRTSVLPIKKCYFHPTLSIPHMDLPIF